MFKVSINTYAVLVLTYSFGLIKWNDTDLKAIERETWKILIKARYYHPKSAVERLTLPRGQGGRDYIDILNQKQKQICNLHEYFFDKQNTSIIHKAIVKANKNYSPLDLCRINTDNSSVTDAEMDRETVTRTIP